MKAFVFRLESVLSVRAIAEKKAQETYAHALQAVMRAARELADAQADLERLQKTLGLARSGGGSTNDQIISLNAIGYQKQLCERDAERLRLSEEEAQKRLQELLEAKRAHEALLRLRSRQHAQYVQEEMRREQVAVDDLVSARYAARRREVAA